MKLSKNIGNNRTVSDLDDDEDGFITLKSLAMNDTRNLFVHPKSLCSLHPTIDECIIYCKKTSSGLNIDLSYVIQTIYMDNYVILKLDDAESGIEVDNIITNSNLQYDTKNKKWVDLNIHGVDDFLNSIGCNVKEKHDASQYMSMQEMIEREFFISSFNKSKTILYKDKLERILLDRLKATLNNDPDHDQISDDEFYQIVYNYINNKNDININEKNNKYKFE